MNIAATVRTAGLANPATASAGVKMPETVNTTMMPNAVTSTGTISVTRRVTEINNMMVTSAIIIVKLCQIKIIEQAMKFKVSEKYNQPVMNKTR
jgi:hypothetical protein